MKILKSNIITENTSSVKKEWFTFNVIKNLVHKSNLLLGGAAKQRASPLNLEKERGSCNDFVWALRRNEERGV